MLRSMVRCSHDRDCMSGRDHTRASEKDCFTICSRGEIRVVSRVAIASYRP